MPCRVESLCDTAEFKLFGLVQLKQVAEWIAQEGLLPGAADQQHALGVGLHQVHLLLVRPFCCRAIRPDGH